MGVLQRVPIVSVTVPCPSHLRIEANPHSGKSETAIIREEGETPNDRNDRGL
jgi:hypothetical protein